jgi:2-polyprenyl-6-hydroxyphenyl methylase/3-demethylubiquinone-9 3-methyltransferase
MSHLHQSILLSMNDDWIGKEVMELGSGTGRLTIPMLKAGAKVTAVDVAQGMLEILAGRVAEAGFADQIAVRQGGATELPFSDASFDLCASVNVFSHLPEPGAALKEIQRVLRPGGAFIGNFPNLQSMYMPAAIWINGKHKAIGRGVYSRWYTYRQIRGYCRDAGLQISEIRGLVHAPPRVLDTKLSFALLRGLNLVSQRGPLKYVSPGLFIKAVKQ